MSFFLRSLYMKLRDRQLKAVIEVGFSLEKCKGSRVYLITNFFYTKDKNCNFTLKGWCVWKWVRPTTDSLINKLTPREKGWNGALSILWPWNRKNVGICFSNTRYTIWVFFNDGTVKIAKCPARQLLLRIRIARLIKSIVKMAMNFLQATELRILGILLKERISRFRWI